MFAQVVSLDSGGAEVSRPMSVPWMQSFLHLGSARETSGENEEKSSLDLSVLFLTMADEPTIISKWNVFKNEYIHSTEEVLWQYLKL